MTIFRGHNNEDENKLTCTGYTNDTHIRIDWKNSPASDIDYYWFGTRSNPKHKKIDASKSFYNGNMTPGSSPYYYTVISVDVNGNESEISEPCGNFNLDQKAPEVSFDNLSANATLSGEYEIRGSLKDDSPTKYIISVLSISGIDSENSGEKIAQTSFVDYPVFDWDTTNVPNGQYAVTFSATDAATNTAYTSVTVEVSNSSTGDTTDPVVNITSPTEGDFVTGPLIVVGDITDESPIEYWVEVRKEASGNTVFASNKKNNQSSISDAIIALFDTTTVNDGEYEVKLLAEDQEGNKDSDEITVMFGNGITTFATTPSAETDKASDNVVINEFLPNPESGNDEFVELYNKSSDKTFDISGWYIQDDSSEKHTLPVGSEIEPEDYLVIDIPNFDLDDSGDTINLFDELDAEVDSKSFDSSTEGKSYQRISDGESSWEEAIPTKNNENESDGEATNSRGSIFVPDSPGTGWLDPSQDESGDARDDSDGNEDGDEEENGEDEEETTQQEQGEEGEDPAPSFLLLSSPPFTPTPDPKDQPKEDETPIEKVVPNKEPAKKDDLKGEKDEDEDGKEEDDEEDEDEEDGKKKEKAKENEEEETAPAKDETPKE